MNIKTIKQEFWETIEKYDRFLLCLHKNADLDSLCSNLAMRELLLRAGKTVTLLAGENNNFPESFAIFATDLRFISNHSIPEIDQNDYDYFIMLDIASESRLYDVSSSQIVIPKIVIDHHAGNNISGAEFSFIDPSRSSTAEMVAELGFIDSDEFKSYIYMGIYADTMGFKFSMSSRVFEILQKTFTKKTTRMVLCFEKSFTINDFKLLQTVIEKEKFVYNRESHKISLVVVCLSAVDTALLAPFADTGKIISIYEKRSDIDIFILAIQQGEDLWRLRIRSYVGDREYAKEIAEEFGGTGHAQSAGAILSQEKMNRLRFDLYFKWYTKKDFKLV